MDAKTRSAKSDKPAVDVYQMVTDKMMELLAAGTVPWRQTWVSVGSGLPKSLSTGKTYKGVNVFLLNLTAAVKGYSSPWWGTYNQIEARGGQVRKGERGTEVVLWKIIHPKPTAEQRAAGEKPRPIFFLRYYNVFNADQCDNVTVPTGPVVDLQDHSPIDECELLVKAYIENGGPELRIGGDEAYYEPAADRVTVPPLAQFSTPEFYYTATFHECAHSTGHASRLDRKSGVEGSCHFGSPNYAKEELVAEMTTAMLAGVTGLDMATQDVSAAYLENWLGVLGNDSKMVVQAAAAAQKAADLIRGIKPEAPAQESTETAQGE